MFKGAKHIFYFMLSTALNSVGSNVLGISGLWGTETVIDDSATV